MDRFWLLQWHVIPAQRRTSRCSQPDTFRSSRNPVVELGRYVTLQNMTTCWSSLMKRALRNWKGCLPSLYSVERLWSRLSTRDMFETAPNLLQNFVDLLILTHHTTALKTTMSILSKRKQKKRIHIKVGSELTIEVLHPTLESSFSTRMAFIFCSRRTYESLYRSWFVV